jgi:hypothetical protein
MQHGEGVSTVSERKRDIAARFPLRRGLGTAEAAIYLSLSSTKFTQLVADGRMPRPHLIDGRRVWDIDDLDAAFKAMPIEGGAPDTIDRDIGYNPWHHDGPPDDLDAAAALASHADEEFRRVREEVRLESELFTYGMDTQGFTEEARERARVAQTARREDTLRRSPLGKLERRALARLYELRDRFVARGEIKGAGHSTVESLGVRGYANVRMNDNRLEGWQITERGIAAYEAGSLPGF